MLDSLEDLWHSFRAGTGALPGSPADCESLDIDQLAHLASRYRQYMAGLRASIASGFDWYPFDPYASLHALRKVLTGERRQPLKTVSGYPILDAGAGDGDLAFFFDRLGYTVHALDHPTTNFNGMQGIAALHARLRSRVRIESQDLDGPIRLPARLYGLAMCFGVLYHLKNPFHLLETLAKHALYCALSTRIAQLGPDRRTELGKLPIAYLVDPLELNNDSTNYWIFTEPALRRVLSRSGWEILDFGTIGCESGSDPVHDDADQRAFCFLRSRIAQAPYEVFLTRGWHSLEQEQWRWTQKSFAMTVRSSPLAYESLELRFHLPEPRFRESGALTIRTRCNGADLPPQTFVSPGEHVLRQRLPNPEVSEQLDLEFELDHCAGPSASDQRELGIIVPVGEDSPAALSLRATS